MNILITGSNGFLGKSLKKYLGKSSKYKIYNFNRNHTFSDLKKYICDIDFIFHFAGAPDPKSGKSELIKGNEKLTKKIIQIIEGKKLKIPIVFTSTLHAKYSKNDYGISKRNAEIALENYSEKNFAKIFIYRLPHIFGNGAKPNHNSVITTWLYNASRNIEIIVFDRKIKMEYVYSNDIIDQFVDHLKDMKFEDRKFYKPNIVYKTTLGEIFDSIMSFKENTYDKSFTDLFKKKLYHTFKYYINYE